MSRYFTALAILCWIGSVSFASFSYTTSGAVVSQNFDTLPSGGTLPAPWTNNSTLSGWYLFDRNSNALSTIRYGDGSSLTGSFYSFGSSNSSERALGGVGSGNAYFGSPAGGAVAGYISFSATNMTGQTLSSFTTAFNGEQWLAAADSLAQTMVFEYGFGTSFTTVSNWNTPSGTFNWSSTQTATSATNINGNTAGLVSGRGGTINTTWSPGQTLWLRWIERNDTGNDHGLAIDDFSFSAITAVPEPSSMVIGILLGLCGIIYIRYRLTNKITLPAPVGWVASGSRASQK